MVFSYLYIFNYFQRLLPFVLERRNKGADLQHMVGIHYVCLYMFIYINVRVFKFDFMYYFLAENRLNLHSYLN